MLAVMDSSITMASPGRAASISATRRGTEIGAWSQRLAARALGTGVLGLERAKRVMATGRRVAEAGVRAPLDGRAERRQGGARVACSPTLTARL